MHCFIINILEHMNSTNINVAPVLRVCRCSNNQVVETVVVYVASSSRLPEALAHLKTVDGDVILSAVAVEAVLADVDRSQIVVILRRCDDHAQVTAREKLPLGEREPGHLENIPHRGLVIVGGSPGRVPTKNNFSPQHISVKSVPSGRHLKLFIVNASDVSSLNSVSAILELPADSLDVPGPDASHHQIPVGVHHGADGSLGLLFEQGVSLVFHNSTPRKGYQICETVRKVPFSISSDCYK